MVEKKQLERGGKDMINKVIFSLDINGDSLIIKVDDKYIRIKVRYSGEDLAIVSAIITQYKESYS